MTIDGITLIKDINKCPSIKKHTLQPTGYSTWHLWAENKAKTHDNIRCKDCGYAAIWVRRNKIAS